jgi:hypothetical protein
MKTIAVTEITEGLVLARAVTDDSGRELLARGLALGPHHAELLARRGIASVTIEAEEDGRPAEDAGETEPGLPPAGNRSGAVLAPAAQEALAELEHAFEKVLDEPDMRRLYELACERARRRA